MDKLLLYCCIFLMSASLFGDELLQGLLDYQAKSPDLAASHFREHLQEKLSQEERQVTLYNLATALATAHSYESARKIFEEIEVRAITSPTVREALQFNEALLLIRMGKEATLAEGVTLAKELPENKRQVLLEEAEIKKMELLAIPKNLSSIALQNEIETLFCYIEHGGNDPLYFQKVRNFVDSDAANPMLLRSIFRKNFQMQMEKNSLLSALEGYIMTDMDANWPFFQEEKEWCRDTIEEYLSHQISKQDTLQNSLLKLLQARLRKDSPEDVFLFYKLFQEREEALYRMIFEETKMAPFALQILQEKLKYADNKKAAAALQKSDKKALIRSWLLFDEKSCLNYLIDNFSEENAPFFFFAWNEIRRGVQPVSRLGTLDGVIQLLQKALSAKQNTKILLSIMQYWLFYDTPKEGDNFVPFAIDFEKQAMNVEQSDAMAAREVTLQILQKVQKMNLSSELQKEVKTVLGIVQDNRQFQMQRVLHSRARELLEKIAKLQQKSQNEKKPSEAPKNESGAPQPMDMKIKANDALELLQEMHNLDKDVKEVPQKASGGVKYPW